MNDKTDSWGRGPKLEKPRVVHIAEKAAIKTPVVEKAAIKTPVIDSPVTAPVKPKEVSRPPFRPKTPFARRPEPAAVIRPVQPFEHPPIETSLKHPEPPSSSIDRLIFPYKYIG